MRHDVLCGDAREVLRTLEDASVDAVVTDPPYALTQVSRGGSPRTNDPTKPYGRHRLADKGFMGQQWDNGSAAHDPAFWAEVRRVVTPGAYLLAFGGTRTYHRLASAVEDGGWECRDMLNWLFGSGFPKSKSCLKPAHEPILLAKAPGPLQPLQIDACRVPTAEIGSPRAYEPRQDREQWRITGGSNGSGATSSAGRWPSNLVLSHHPDCRPAGMQCVHGNGHYPAARGAGGLSTAGHTGQRGLDERHMDDEHVQAWVCVEGCPIKALDEQAGPRTSGGRVHRRGDMIVDRWHEWQDRTDTHRRGSDNAWEASTGSASRFFPTFLPEPEDAAPFRYCPKASRRERNTGLDGLPERPAHPGGSAFGETTMWNGENGDEAWRAINPNHPQANHHPTVKPIALMQWLVRLVCPPSGLVLDPFCGSGSTLVACVREGMGFIGIDQDEQYCEIARRRVAYEQEQQTGPLFAGVSAASK